MRVAEMTESKKNPVDDLMTPAQIARRKFKAGLPRKPQDRQVSPMEALAQLFTYVDQFRTEVIKQGGDPDTAVHAALAYYQPQSDPATLAAVTRPLPVAAKIGKFCDEVTGLDRPTFLGVVFIHVDGDTKKAAYETVSFCVPFLVGAEATSRLLFAQKLLLSKIGKPLPHRA